jgi:hypothetical protein
VSDTADGETVTSVTSEVTDEGMATTARDVAWVNEAEVPVVDPLSGWHDRDAIIAVIHHGILQKCVEATIDINAVCIRTVIWRYKRKRKGKCIGKVKVRDYKFRIFDARQERGDRHRSGGFYVPLSVSPETLDPTFPSSLMKWLGEFFKVKEPLTVKPAIEVKYDKFGLQQFFSSSRAHSHQLLGS